MDNNTLKKSIEFAKNNNVVEFKSSLESILDSKVADKINSLRNQYINTIKF